MRIFRSFIGYAFAAIACLGYSGLSFASGYVERPDWVTALSYVSDHGAESAKFKAELAHAVSMDSVMAVAMGGLIGDGNGYLQARADATVGQGVGNQVSLS